MSISTLPPSSAARPFEAVSARVPGAVHVLLLTTGSVASVKAPLIADALLQHANVQLQVVATEPSLTFYNPAEVETASTRRGKTTRVWRDADEWQSWKKMGDPILHIELRRWADVVLVAPCSANTLAKIAGGLCDNLATSLLRALEPTTPTFLFPAMNTHMFAHPLTARHLEVVQNVIGYTVVGPVGKTLACGDVGLGAMTEWSEIVGMVERVFVRRAAEAAETASTAEMTVKDQSLSAPSTSTNSFAQPPPSPQTAMSGLNLLSPPPTSQRAPSSSTSSPAVPRPIPVRLKSRWDELISYSTPAITPSHTPPPPTPSPSAPASPPFDRDIRHPLTLPLSSIEGLIAGRILPPTLNHSAHSHSHDDGSDSRRLFWFVPSRLEKRQLEGLARASGADKEGGGKRGEWADEVCESREWLERCYGPGEVTNR